MDITITINTDNAAFDGLPNLEVGRILQGLEPHILDIDLTPGVNFPIIDYNGNRVGQFTVKES